MHAATQELTDSQKSSALNAIRNLLQDPELVADADAQKALLEITSMEKELDVKNVERKVLADFQLAVYDHLEDFKREMQRFKGKCANINTKMQKRSLNVEKQVKKLKQLLQAIKNRMEEMNKRNTPQSTWNSIGRSLDKSLKILVGNFNSLPITSVLRWNILLIILTCFTCLDHNSYNDGKPNIN